MRESIKQILIRRDNMTETEAEELIEEAREALQEYIEADDWYYADDICQEYFNLEPDYLDELM